jgi:hypothetical protein
VARGISGIIFENARVSLEIYGFWNYFPMENLVDRVHGVWTGRRGLSPWWTKAAWTRGCGGALSARGCWGSLVLADGGGGG